MLCGITITPKELSVGHEGNKIYFLVKSAQLPTGTFLLAKDFGVKFVIFSAFLQDCAKC
jgi:hypothetical protein